MRARFAIGLLLLVLALAGLAALVGDPAQQRLGVQPKMNVQIAVTARRHAEVQMRTSAVSGEHK
jgi:hypothetical protein